MSLDMSPYTTKHKEKGKSSNVVHACVYELYSVVVHKGKMDSGHYISYSKDKNDWFMFDDSKVVLVSEADVLQANAYLLFYVVRNLEG